MIDAISRPAIFALTLLALAGCSSTEAPAPEAAGEQERSVVGNWRAVLTSPGGELPFGLEIVAAEGGLEGAMLNGDERAPFSSVTVDGNLVLLEAEWYDSAITAELDAEGGTLRGSWQRTAADDTLFRLPFHASRGDDRRFRPLDELGLEPSQTPAPPSVTGVWEVELTDEDGTAPARGELRQQGGDVLGTFLTSTGDYRYLEGTYEQGVLRLSTFDGSHAVLFQAKAQEDGSLAGDFWSQDTYHATWTARPAAAESTAPPDTGRNVAPSG